jgi:hypothetical protein
MAKQSAEERVIAEAKKHASLSRNGSDFYCYRYKHTFSVKKLYYCKSIRNCPHWDIRLHRTEETRQYWEDRYACGL